MPMFWILHYVSVDNNWQYQVQIQDQNKYSIVYMKEQRHQELTKNGFAEKICWLRLFQNYLRLCVFFFQMTAFTR